MQFKKAVQIECCILQKTLMNTSTVVLMLLRGIRIWNLPWQGRVCPETVTRSNPVGVLDGRLTIPFGTQEQMNCYYMRLQLLLCISQRSTAGVTCIT